MQLVVSLLNRLPKQPRTVLTTCVLALAAATSAVAFQLAINAFYNSLARLSTGPVRVFVAGSLIIILSSSLIVGWLLNSFCKEAAGSGIPQLKLAFWKDFGFVPWRTVWVKFLAGALNIGGGGSLGREGPSVHIAGGIASNLAGFFGEPKQNRRRAAAAGAAAGLAAAFNTPLASITFVLEEMIEDLNSRFLGSVVLASVIGAMVVHGIVGEQPAFTLRHATGPGLMGYLILPLVATMASLVGFAFQKSTMHLRPTKRFLPGVPLWARPAMGGLITWGLGVGVFVATGHLGVFSLGYDDLSLALANQLTWKIALTLVVTKLIATIACYAFGGCGGIFSPTLFLGGMTGAAISGLFALGLPLTLGDHITLAVVGMSACLGAVVGAPLTGILIVFEMTHEFSLVPALMVGALISQMLRRVFCPDNFYEEILLQDGHDLDKVIPPRDLRDWQQLPVSAIANFRPVFANGLAPAEVKDLLGAAPFSRFPYLKDSKLAGIVARKELERAMADKREPELEPVTTIRPSQTIREAQPLLLAATTSMVCVTEEESGRPIGILTLHDLLRAQLAFADKKE